MTAVEKILVVDEQQHVSSSLSHLLRTQGYMVTFASDGDDALELLETNPDFDLIFADIRVEENSGLGMLKEARRLYPNMPVVMMSNDSSDEMILDAMRTGAFDYLMKPLDAARLHDVICRANDFLAQQARPEKIPSQIEHFSLSLCYSTSDIDITNLQQVVSEALAKYTSADQSEIINILLALEEAVQNAIEHGNLELDSAWKDERADLGHESLFEKAKCERLSDNTYARRRVKIGLRYETGEIAVTVEDDGPGFSRKIKSAVTGESYGMGLMIIKSISDDIHFNEAGNRITFVKKLEQ